MEEFLRKVLHLLFGLLIVAVIAFVPKPQAIIIIAVSLLAGAVLIDALIHGFSIPMISRLVKNLGKRDAFPGKGAFFFVLSSLACLIVFDVSVVVPAVLALAVLDSVSTIIGVRLGRHRIYNGKSWEGFLSGIAITAACLLVILSPLYACITAVTAGIVEMFSPVDDNLLIPLVVCIVLSLAGVPG
jgi:Dolichol kinase